MEYHSAGRRVGGEVLEGRGSLVRKEKKENC
jgi:hypothetical protein